MDMKIILLGLFISLIHISIFGQTYTRADIEGIWILNFNLHSDESPEIFSNEFYIFRDSSWLTIWTHENMCMTCIHHHDKTEKKMCVYRYWFFDNYDNIDSLKNEGRYLVRQIVSDYNNESKFFPFGPLYFSVIPKQDMQFGYHECSYLERLPKKAQIVLYDNSRNDHRNYAREFLEYDICGVKNKGCQLLDSLLQPMGITIPKGDIVVVRDTCGDVLQVEYEPERDKYITGYLRKEELEFVQTQE